jgi:hypothetical protein
MAKQKGPVYFTGCSGGITFYRMDGVYYQRRKSSLSGKRVKRSQAFKRTMEYAGLLGRASQLAAAVYRSLPKAERKHALYLQLTGQAMQLLKQGMEEALVTEQLQQYVAIKKAPVTQAPAAAKPAKRLRITTKKPAAAALRLKAGRLWIIAHEGLHKLSAHAGDLHHKVLPVSSGRCLVPG